MKKDFRTDPLIYTILKFLKSESILVRILMGYNILLLQTDPEKSHYIIFPQTANPHSVHLPPSECLSGQTTSHSQEIHIYPTPGKKTTYVDWTSVSWEESHSPLSLRASLWGAYYHISRCAISINLSTSKVFPSSVNGLWINLFEVIMWLKERFPRAIASAIHLDFQGLIYLWPITLEVGDGMLLSIYPNQ